MSATNFPTPPRYKQLPNPGPARQGTLTQMARVAVWRASQLTGRSVNHMGCAQRDRGRLLPTAQEIQPRMLACGGHGSPPRGGGLFN